MYPNITDSLLRFQILPVAISQTEPSQRVQRRVIAAKLIEKLCSVLPPVDVHKELAPCAQMLARDTNPNVRSSIAQRLGVIAQSLDNVNDSASLLLPCLVELCKDDDLCVREAILNTIAVCLPHFSKESQKSSIIPLLKKSTEQAIFLQDETLSVVAKNFGQWIFTLKDVMMLKDRKWFLDAYIRIANLAQNSSVASSASSTSFSPNYLLVSARRMCAYNFPCIVMVYGKECFNDRLLPLLESYCSDLDDDVRSAVAAGFHEIVNFYPNDPGLIRPFIELIRDGAAEVVGHLTSNLDKILTAFYKCLAGMNETDTAAVNRAQLNRIIIGCNRLIRGAGSWRAHQSYLTNIAVIRKYIPTKDLFISFVPMLKQEVLTARAIPCRIAAAVTLLLFMKENPDGKERQAIIDFFVHSVAKHRSCHRRRLMLDVTPPLMLHFSRDFFHNYLLDSVLGMSADPISNIRLQLCHLLPKIKENLILPQDEDILQKLEKTVRELLANETNLYTRQLLQSYACELSVTGTKLKRDKLDEEKRKDEQEIWSRSTEKENEMAVKICVNPVKSSEQRSVANKDKVPVLANKSSLGNLSRHSDTLPWRTCVQSKPKTAIVRPQPQVVVVQRSPSPMPRSDRKSILPLSNLNKDTNNSSTSGRFSIPRPSVVRVRDKQPLRQQNSANISKNTNLDLPPQPRSTNSASSGLRRSATSSTGFGAKSSSQRSLQTGLMTSRSSSCLRSPSPSPIKVQSFSSIERRPMHMSMRIRAVD
uniref:Non-specific serine/threonine protein kinase n=1 Tax=Syphacia muris TaxID=451379 RepID=A0A158R506_9BILA